MPLPFTLFTSPSLLPRFRRAASAVCALLVAFACIALYSVAVPSTAIAAEEDAAEDTAQSAVPYWAHTAGAYMYGTSEAMIKVGDRFTPTDAAFRVYARDFEDGDITPEISRSGDTIPTDAQHKVSPEAAGKTYTVTHSVTDSEGNAASFTTTITVLSADSPESRSITKVVYNNPSTWNTQLQGIQRMDGHDRQVIGLTVPVGASVTAAVESGGTPITFVGNTNNEPGAPDAKAVTINSGGSAQLFGSDGAPTALALKTPLNTKAEGNIRKDIKVTLTYGDSIGITPYFYTGDSQEEFFADWDSRHELQPYAFIEGRRSLVLAHYDDDREQIASPARISSELKTSLAYFDAIAQRYDELIGLDTYAEDPLDQQVKTKQFFKANDQGGGAAYYGGDHIAVSQKYLWSLFDWGWGTLHEIGHGYQGTLGKKTGESQFDGGETTNNLLAYYVQHNPDILDVTGHNGYWYDRPSGETNVHTNYRLSTETAEMNTVGKALLTTMISLADAAGQSPYRDESAKDEAGREPLGQLNHWYRAYLDSGKTIPNESAWTLAFADCFNMNILPVLDAWNVKIPASTRAEILNRPQLDNLIFIADVVGVGSDGISARADLEQHITAEIGESRFGLISTRKLGEILEKTFSDESQKLVGGVTVKVSENGSAPSPDFSSTLAGAKAYLVDSGRAVAETVFNAEAGGFEFAGVPVGAYTVQVPAIAGYELPMLRSVMVTPNAALTAAADYHSGSAIISGSGFELKGKTWGTTALKAAIDPATGIMTVRLGESATGCMASTGEGDCLKVEILGSHGTVKTYGKAGGDGSSADSVGGTSTTAASWALPFGSVDSMTQLYQDAEHRSADVPVTVGDRVLVRYFLWNRADRTVFTDAAGAVQPDNAPTAMETLYRVTPVGLLRDDISQEEERALVADTAKAQVDAVKAQISDEDLRNPLASTAAKAALLSNLDVLLADSDALDAAERDRYTELKELVLSQTRVTSEEETVPEKEIANEEETAPEDKPSVTYEEETIESIEEVLEENLEEAEPTQKLAKLTDLGKSAEEVKVGSQSSLLADSGSSGIAAFAVLGVLALTSGSAALSVRERLGVA